MNEFFDHWKLSLLPIFHNSHVQPQVKDNDHTLRSWARMSIGWSGEISRTHNSCAMVNKQTSLTYTWQRHSLFLFLKLSFVQPEI